MNVDSINKYCHNCPYEVQLVEKLTDCHRRGRYIAYMTFSLNCMQFQIGINVMCPPPSETVENPQKDIFNHWNWTVCFFCSQGLVYPHHLHLYCRLRLLRRIDNCCDYNRKKNVKEACELIAFNICVDQKNFPAYKKLYVRSLGQDFSHHTQENKIQGWDKFWTILYC